LQQAVQVTAAELNEAASVVGTLRRDQGGIERFLLSLGELHVRGHALDWTKVLPRGQRVALPTYGFVRERYWPDSGMSAVDVASAGLSPGEHPLLGASLQLAEAEGMILTGRLSCASQPWLSGHVVFGATIMPGTGLLELALAAAQRVGLDTVQELTLH